MEMTSHPQDAEPPAGSSGSAIPLSTWYTLAVLSAVSMFAYADRMAIAILQEQIKAELHASDGQMGLLLGLAFVLFYSTMGIPLARVADRAPRPLLLAVCLALWSGMTSLCGLARSFPQLFLARVGVGVGEAGCVPPAHSLIGDLFPREKRAFAIGVFQSGATIGVSAGLALTGLLGELYGWRTAFVILGITGLPLSLLLVLTIREPRKKAKAGDRDESTWQAISALIRRRAFVHLLLAYALGSLSSFGIMQWLPSFLMRSFGMNMAEVGAWAGLTSLVSGVSGLLVGGLLVAWLMKRDARWELWLPAGAMGLSFPLFVLMVLSPVAWIALVMKALATFLGAVGSGVALSTIQTFAEPHRRATAVSLVMLISALLGQGLGPYLIGTASDMLAPAFGRESLRYALLMSCVLLVWSVVHYLLAARTSRRDQVN